ncbi:MAG: DOMON-like domain-containing protein [Pseudomonadota bacterium]
MNLRYILDSHPDSPCEAIELFEVDIHRVENNQLTLDYHIKGAIPELNLPPAKRPIRAHELWLHSCFELFIGLPASTAYTEFNFAPSMAWAAYQFDSYREGMREAADISSPHMESHRSDSSYQLHVVLQLAALPRHLTWQLGISAVIEETRGHQSFWALAHPSGQPDFHHSDGFACTLTP